MPAKIWKKRLWVADPCNGDLHLYKGRIDENKDPEVVLMGRRLGLLAGDNVEVTIRKVR